MSNNTPQVAQTQRLEILKRIESGALSPEKALQQLQSQGQSVTEGASQPLQPQQIVQPSKTYTGKVLKIQVFEGDPDQPKVSVALPLALAKWAAKVIPHAAKQKIQEQYADFDINAICDMVDEGIEELEQIGRFDFVTVQDGDEKVQIFVE